MFHHARLDHVEHVAVAVVVVADVLLVQPRHRRDLERRADVAAIPLGDHLLPIRVDGRPQQQDDVLEHVRVLRVVGLRQQVVGQLHRVLRAGDLARVQPAVDVDDGLALARQLAGIGLAQPGGMGQPPRDLAVAIDLRQVGGRGDGGQSSRFAPAWRCRRASSPCDPRRRPASESRRRSRRRWRSCSPRRPGGRGRIPEKAAPGPGRRRAAGRSARPPPAGSERLASRHSTRTAA